MERSLDWGEPWKDLHEGVTDQTCTWKTSWQQCGLHQQFGREGGIEVGRPGSGGGGGCIVVMATGEEE